MKIGQAVRDDGPQTHLTKAGTPTMGGALILVVDRRHDAAVGRPVEPLRLGGAAGHARLRRDRLGRRLPQGGAPQSEGHVGAEKYFWQSVIGLVAALYLAFAISSLTAQC